jgi:ComF family protein
MKIVPAALASLLNQTLDALAPGRCVACHVRLARVASRSRSPFCLRCELALPWWRGVDGCPRCGERARLRGAAHYEPDPFPGSGDACSGCLSRGSALHVCHALLRYEGAVRRWVPVFKNPSGPFGPSPAVACAIDFLARELALRVRAEVPSRLDLLVSVPLHPRRHRRRGFNHADLIARRIASSLGLPWRPGDLERVRETRPQASLQGPDRIENLIGAFRAQRSFDSDCRIGLVDDVLTTGSTLEAAASALLDAGALEVRGLTLAATLPRRARRPAHHPTSGASSARRLFSGRLD